MSTDRQDRIMMILSIIERGKAKAYIGTLKGKGIEFHIQCVGQGTASSEMMDILGLSSNDKDIVISYAPRRIVSALAAEITKDLSTSAGYNGLMMLLSMSAVSRVMAEFLLLGAKDNETEGEESAMRSEYRHSLILIMVDRGHTDKVMQTARKAGATGGTVIRARLEGVEQMELMQAREEKEIIAILASDSVRNQIMEAVNLKHGMRADARGLLCAVPVDRAMKI